MYQVRHHVFLSYTRTDRDWVDALAAALLRRGLTYWQDRDIPPSYSWTDEAFDAIRESLTFISCDSPKARTSRGCLMEMAQAAGLGKPYLPVEVGQDPERVADQVGHFVRAVPAPVWARTELRSRTTAWERADGARRALADRPTERRLRFLGLPPQDDRLTTPELDFLRASRSKISKQTRRATLFINIGICVIVGAILLGTTIYKVLQKSSTVSATGVAEIENVNDQRATTAGDPYAGLRAAAAAGTNESFAHSFIVQDGLRYPVPDDAFAAPGAVRFGARPVGSDVLVVAADGTGWRRAATATSERQATRTGTLASGQPAGAPTASLAGTDHLPAMTAALEPGGEAVRVTRDGALYHRVTLPAVPTALVFSPDGRLLTASVGTEVEIFDLDSGREQNRLRGAPAAITDVAWSADGARVWAVAGGTVVSWRALPYDVVLDEPGVWFQALLPAGSPSTGWLVTRDGQLRELALDTGVTSRTWSVPDTVFSAAADPAGRTAVLVGKSHDWIVDLAARTARPFSVPSCPDAGRAAFAVDGGRFYLPCRDGANDVVTVDVTTATVERRYPVPGGAGGLALAATSGQLVVGGSHGAVYALTLATGAERKLSTINCQDADLGVAVAPTGDEMFPYGWGTADSGCSQIYQPGGGSLVDSVGAPGAYTAAFDPAGKALAVGYASGDVVLHPVPNLTPEVQFALPGAVRDTVFRGDSLYLLTWSGVLARVTVCDACLSNKAQAAQAAGTLAQSVRIGLAAPAPAATSTSTATPTDG